MVYRIVTIKGGHETQRIYLNECRALATYGVLNVPGVHYLYEMNKCVRVRACGKPKQIDR